MGPARLTLPESGSHLAGVLRRRVRIDARALAVFRVLAGLLVVADLFLRARNFTFFYTDAGVVPRSLVLETLSYYPASVYHFTTDPRLIAALFVVQGLIAIQLLVGYRTRLATVLTFALVVSLDHHNPFVLSYADTLFRLLLFWAIFLPLGERWSIDAVHRERDPRPFVANAASALILAQMVYMYLTNGLIKSQSSAWTGGDAAPLVLGLDEITFLLGETVRQFPTLLEVGGLLWFVMLVCSPLLLLLRGYPRAALAGLFVGGHLAFAVTVRIGAFPYVALAGVLLFFPGRFWDGLAALRRHLGVDDETIETGIGRLKSLAARVPDWRLTDERVRRVRERAYAVAIGTVVLTIAFVAVVMAANVGAALVDGGDEPLEERIDGTVDETLEETTGVQQVHTVARTTGIDQPVGWGVFAGPDPRTTDRYHVFPAETADGDLVDAYNDRPLTFDRPHDGALQEQYGTYRERFYMNSVRRGGYGSDLGAQLAEHVCETWADEYDEELVRLEMYLVEEEITRETIDDPEHREREYDRFNHHGCGDNETGVVASPPS